MMKQIRIESPASFSYEVPDRTHAFLIHEQINLGKIIFHFLLQLFKSTKSASIRFGGF